MVDLMHGADEATALVGVTPTGEGLTRREFERRYPGVRLIVLEYVEGTGRSLPGPQPGPVGSGDFSVYGLGDSR